MNLEEAYKILGTDSNAGIEEVMKVSASFSALVAGISHFPERIKVNYTEQCMTVHINGSQMI